MNLRRFSFLALFLLISSLSGAEETVQPLSLAHFAVPENLGKVQERFQGSSDFWVVHIQDVHGHPTAQENISAILDHLQTVYGISKVAVEGSWLETSLPNSQSLANSREKQLLARGLLDEGYLTGPGYAALFSPSPLLLTGIEDPASYQKNRQAYLDFLAEEKSVEAGLKKFHEQLKSEKSAAYSEALLAFDQKLETFRDTEKTDKFLPQLFNALEAHKIEMSDLNQLELFAKILEISSKIPKERLESEAQRLVQKYKFAKLTFEELLRSGTVTADELQYYPAVSMYLELIGYQDKIDHHLFITQMEAAIVKIQNQLAQTEVEKSLIGRSEDFQLAKKILTFHATPATLADYESKKTAIQLLVQDAGLQKGFDIAIRFYDEAKVRDGIFYEKLARAGQSSNVAAVTGGFHTDGLSRKLREAGISYLVITPDLGGEAPNEKMYLNELKRPIPDNQTLSQFLQYMMPVFDQIFPTEVAATKKANNVMPSVARIAQAATASAPAAAAAPDVPEGPAAAPFAAMSEDERSAQLTAQLDESATAAEPKVLLVDAKTLSKLLASPFGKKLWEAYVVSNKQNLIVVPFSSPDDIPSDAASGKRSIDLRPGTLEEVVASQTFQNRYRRRLEQKNDIAVIAPEGSSFSHSSMLKLEAQEISLLFRLFLAMRETAETPEGFLKLKEILLNLGPIQRLRTSA